MTDKLLTMYVLIENGPPKERAANILIYRSIETAINKLQEAIDKLKIVSPIVDNALKPAVDDSPD